MLRWWIVAAWLPLLASSPKGLPDGYARRVWQTQDGLPENTVQAFVQTSDNYLWIGTSGGLVRFDGERFVLFDRDNTPVIRENSIFCLGKTKDGSLWAGTDGHGLLRYRNGSFRSYSTPQGLTNDFVRAVTEDSKGVLWVGTDNGLFRLQNDRLVRVDGSNQIPALAVHAIYEDRGGNIWVGGSTVIRINGNQAKEFRLEGRGSATRVKTILETADGTVWVGAVSGLQRLPKATRESGVFERVPELASTVRALLEDQSGTLWIGTIGDGLIQYARGRFTRINVPETPPSSTMLALYEDNERNIWTGMQTGMLRLSRTAMSTFSLPDTANADFGTVYPDRDGSLWVASTHLYRVAPAGDRSELIAAPSPGIRVRSVMRDRTGALWIGTEGDGVFRKSGREQIQYTKRAGLVNDFTRALLEARNGDVWIGTDEGISVWREGRLTNYTMEQGLTYFSIRALLEDRSGDIWIGTERGLNHWRNGSFMEDEVTRRLRTEKVWAIHEDNERGLWFGTRGGGLYRWRNGRLSTFTTAQGLATNSIYQVLEDSSGTFWMSGPNGISSMRRHDLERTADQPGFRPSVTLYGLSDGVEATQIYGGVQPAGCVTRSGEVWFPSNRGPVRMMPQSPSANLPKVVIEQVWVDGREAPTVERLVVPPGRGRLQIDYSAVRLRSQERLRFRYKLESFDPEWTDASRRRVAYYTNVPPGTYRFIVQAFELDTPERATEATLPIEWRAPLYRSPWFIAVSVAALMGLAFAGYRLRLRQVHARFHAVLDERNRVAREMHDTVIQGCASVSALLEGVVASPQDEPAWRRELIDCARTQVRETVDEARRAIWNLRQADRATPEIGPLLDQIAQQVSHASRVPVHSDITGRPTRLDPAVEHDILMVAREAMYNATRHGHPQEVRLEVRFEDDRIRMRVMDDGCGFDAKAALATPGEHFGLVGMRERIERWGGRFDVDTAPGSGTRLVVEVPARKP